MRWGKAHAHRTLQLHNRLELFSQTLGQGRKAWLAPVGGNQGAANEVNGCDRSARQSYFTRPADSRWLPCRVAQPEDVTVSCCSIAAAHNPERFPLGQSLIFGSVFVSIAMCTDTIYALTASALASMIRQRSGSRPYGRYISGVTFIGLGVYAALTSSRAAK